MDISKWGLSQIMQLPDHLFGRRWPLIYSSTFPALVTSERLVNDPLPERIVLWEIRWYCEFLGNVVNYVKFALGDHVPANDAEFNAFERIFPGDLGNLVNEGAIEIDSENEFILPMRKPLVTSGRRFAIQAWSAWGLVPVKMTFTFLISSIPREIPDCLIFP